MYKYFIFTCTIIAEVIIVLKIPKGYESISKTFRLPVDLVEKMAQLAASNKISLNKLVVQCLTYAMDNIEEKNDENKTGL